MGRLRRFVAPLAIAATLVVGIAALAIPQALADPFPGTNDGRRADGTTHVYCYHESVTIYGPLSYAMVNLDSQTDMTRSYSSTCYSSTDVVWIEGDLAGTLRGSRGCVKAISSTICDSSELTLDYAQIDVGSDDDEDRKKTACHELGHSVGLGHHDTSSDCMRNGAVPSTALQYRQYRDHVVTSHINPNY